MNSVIEARIKDYCATKLGYGPLECETIVEQITALARAGGHEVDERFGCAGLGAGPEARVASAITGCALVGGGGAETPEYAMRQEIGRWLQSGPRLAGRRGR